MSSAGPLLERLPNHPILTGRDFPADSGIKRVFNSGVIESRGRYIMACRVEHALLRACSVSKAR